MVGGGERSNSVLPNPSLDDDGFVQQRERPGEPTPSQKGRNGGEASVAHLDARYSDS
jgi:hypothetical protein